MIMFVYRAAMVMGLIIIYCEYPAVLSQWWGSVCMALLIKRVAWAWNDYGVVTWVRIIVGGKGNA
jgi:hypothetical protein